MLQTKLKKLNNFRLDLDNARREHGRAELERVRSQQKHDNVPTEMNNKILEHSTSLQGEPNLTPPKLVALHYTHPQPQACGAQHNRKLSLPGACCKYDATHLACGSWQS